MNSSWERVYRNPDKTMEIWELRHRSGALLAELESVSILSNNGGGWDTNGYILSGSGYERFYRSGTHRHELRAIRARIETLLAPLDQQENPASLTDFVPSNSDRISAMIGRDGSRRLLRRKKLADRLARAEESARREIDLLLNKWRRELEAERAAEILSAPKDNSLWLGG